MNKLIGIMASCLASFFFGCIYFLSTRVAPLPTDGLLAYRLMMIIPFVALGILLFKQQAECLALLKRLKAKPALLGVLAFTSANTAFQMWLFMWAPNHNKAIDVSMGYLIVPIILIAFGRWFYQERFSFFKWLAIFFAILGVIINLILTGRISWEMFAVCLGYPLYFIARKETGLNNLSAFLLELILAAPFCLFYISQFNMRPIFAVNSAIYFYLVLIGLVSGLAFICYIYASNTVPMNVFGLLGYLEPLFMLIVAFILGETLSAQSYALMVCLLISVGFLILDGILLSRREKQKCV